MKVVCLLVFIGCVLSSGASAQRLTARSSWEAINNSRHLTVMSPMELNATGGIFNTCINSSTSTFHSIKDVRYCAEGSMVNRRAGEGDTRWEWQCHIYDGAPVSISRTVNKRECVRPVNDESGTYCAEYAQVTYEIPVDFFLDVIESNSDTFYQVAFRKSYRLPECETK